MYVRRANVYDFSDICTMLTEMHRETDVDLTSISPKKLSEVVVKTINDGVVLVAVEDNGKIVGSIGGGTATEWWSNEPIFGDLWFYVYKDNRKSKAGIDLIKRFIRHGEGRHIKLGHVYNGDMDRKDKFYERLGLRKVGSTYIMENK